ncbi:BadF/BadG/BcrA/BcrD ATPase family protein [Zhihengliuella sp.]|uniref:N-acetylglucosamine kinase n=1 Tax=Zhihengliuella sp. TaxID=1954483 RepID=UPI0028127256|nr:BadF/BadG/BcrA/BcrD ATPase family protein [Zhihengliuella sp.]
MPHRQSTSGPATGAADRDTANGGTPDRATADRDTADGGRGGIEHVAIDGGQTGVRAQVQRTGVERPEVVEFPGLITDRPVAEQVVDVVHRIARGSSLALVSAGLSGITDTPAAAASLLDGVRDLGVRSVVVAHDSVTSYLGALGDTTGAVVAAGTGVVTLAVGAEATARIDGWGYSMGDAGSGFWIGSRALDAVMRAHDGRGPATALTPVVEEELGALEHAYIVLQNDPARVSRTAGFAAAVAALSETDEVAARICDEAAEQLALSVSTGLHRVGSGPAGSDGGAAPTVCYLGGVLHGERVRRGVTEILRAEWPELEICEPRGTALHGAAALPSVAPGSALRAQVAFATAS